MAVRRCIEAATFLAFALGAATAPMACRADAAIQADRDTVQGNSLLQEARLLLRDSTGALDTALHDARRRVRAGSPDWLLRRSGSDLFDREYAATKASGASLVVQEDRPDGTDLLTVRYVLSNSGSLQTYAGAGLNRTKYFDTTVDSGPALMNGHNRHNAMGAAAEMGAELRLSEQLVLAADVRWADLHDGANALRSDYGPVIADPVMLGLTVGYRFR